jgi:hypothetical protein
LVINIQSSVNVSYTTRNTIGKLLSQRSTLNQNKFDGSGVHQLICPNCKMKYMGQTGRSFHTRFAEHFRDFKYANHKSKFAQHLLENNHSIGPIDSIMEVLHTTRKGKLMDTLERFHIYNVTHENIQINDKNTPKPNIIFDTIIREEASRQSPPTYPSFATHFSQCSRVTPYTRTVRPTYHP